MIEDSLNKKYKDAFYLSAVYRPFTHFEIIVKLYSVMYFVINLTLESVGSFF